MFQLRDVTTGEIRTIYAVRKSGPQDCQTKFLVFEGGLWTWHWSSLYAPLPAETAPEPRRAERVARREALPLRRTTARLLRRRARLAGRAVVLVDGARDPRD